MQINSINSTPFGSGKIVVAHVCGNRPTEIEADTITEISASCDAEGTSIKYGQFDDKNVDVKVPVATVLSAYTAAMAAPDDVTIDLMGQSRYF